ncbi:MAG: hypothetical protein FWC41_04105 [Firmicutes bacterium]|nr:hypothetical protein [Bacillota bacterium]
MIKTKFNKKIAILLSTLLTTSTAYASKNSNHTKNLNHTIEKKDAFYIKRAKLLKKSYDEKKLGIATILTLIGVPAFAKLLSGEQEETVVSENNSLGIDETEIKKIVENIEKEGELLTVIANDKIDKKDLPKDLFYVLKRYKGYHNLIIRFLSKNDQTRYKETRELYVKSIRDDYTAKVFIAGVYKNAVVMLEGRSMERSCLLTRTLAEQLTLNYSTVSGDMVANTYLPLEDYGPWAPH